MPLGGNPGEYGQYLAGKLPNITGTANRFTMRQNTVSGTGAMQMSDLGQPFSSWACYDKNINFATEGQINFNAKNSNSIYTDNYNYVTPEGYSCLYIIKY